MRHEYKLIVPCIIYLQPKYRVKTQNFPGGYLNSVKNPVAKVVRKWFLWNFRTCENESCENRISSSFPLAGWIGRENREFGEKNRGKSRFLLVPDAQQTKSKNSYTVISHFYTFEPRGLAGSRESWEILPLLKPLPVGILGFCNDSIAESGFPWEIIQNQIKSINKSKKSKKVKKVKKSIPRLARF